MQALRRRTAGRAGLRLDLGRSLTRAMSISAYPSAGALCSAANSFGRPSPRRRSCLAHRHLDRADAALRVEQLEEVIAHLARHIERGGHRRITAAGRGPMTMGAGLGRRNRSLRPQHLERLQAPGELCRPADIDEAELCADRARQRGTALDGSALRSGSARAVRGREHSGRDRGRRRSPGASLDQARSCVRSCGVYPPERGPRRNRAWWTLRTTPGSRRRLVSPCCRWQACADRRSACVRRT